MLKTAAPKRNKIYKEPHRATSGFTLIELLVVIALLVPMLLPVSSDRGAVQGRSSILSPFKATAREPIWSSPIARRAVREPWRIKWHHEFKTDFAYINPLFPA